MKIERETETRLWVLSDRDRVLYRGRRSPWDNPAIIREAQAKCRRSKQDSGVELAS